MHLALLGWLGCEDQGLVQLDPPIPTTTTTTPPTGTDVPTWQDVAPILEARCLQCHLGEGPAPMSLETYASARAWAPSIAVAVVSVAPAKCSEMPLFSAVHRCALES